MHRISLKEPGLELAPVHEHFHITERWVTIERCIGLLLYVYVGASARTTDRTVL